MNRSDLTISIVIPTFGREQVLLDTIACHLEQVAELSQFDECIVIDQTVLHEQDVDKQLGEWEASGHIRWLRWQKPHLTKAMNAGLLEARSDIVLFTDDDVIPAPGWLTAHLEAHQRHPEVWGVVGQILQPGQEPEDVKYEPRGGSLKRYMDFPFRCNKGQFIENAMAGNLSLKREKAIKAGGFDENFPPPVASRFESEFAKRVVSSGGKIWFEPRASLRHLAAPSGGTRSKGSHLTSMSPRYGVGDCYFAMRVGEGSERFRYLLRKPFREVRTKFHLRNPWWIPIKFLGEIRAFLAARKLRKRPPLLIKSTEIR